MELIEDMGANVNKCSYIMSTFFFAISVKIIL